MLEGKNFGIALLLGGCVGDKADEPVDAAVDVEDVDDDGDGYAEPDDCDDGDAQVHPAAVEVCDGVDNNCDDTIDEGVLLAYYSDVDEDGFGDPAAEQQACERPTGAVASNTDCDDGDAQTWPGAPERAMAATTIATG
jgi:Putative metal-binding motif